MARAAVLGCSRWLRRFRLCGMIIWRYLPAFCWPRAEALNPSQGGMPHKRCSPLFTPYGRQLVVTSYLTLDASVCPPTGNMAVYLSLSPLSFNPWFLCPLLFVLCVFLQDVVSASGFTVGKSPTVHKDKLHPCNLLLSGDNACLYVRTLIPLNGMYIWNEWNVHMNR